MSVLPHLNEPKQKDILHREFIGFSAGQGRIHFRKKVEDQHRFNFRRKNNGVFHGPLYFLTALILLQTTNCLFISGKKEMCWDEGVVVNISLVVSDPCITCFCRNHVVTCSKEMCTEPQCNVFIENKNACCRSCLGCAVNGQKYVSSKLWEKSDNSCRIFNCFNGIWSRTNEQCHAICSDPIAPTNGSCCSSCRGCTYNGVRYKEGDEFLLKDERCVTCKCNGGMITCSKKSCPVLACERKMSRMSEDGCCPVCVESRNVFPLDNGGCWFRRKILQNSEKIIVDSCTTCVCESGTMVCDIETCPMIPKCSASEYIFLSPHCCPKCPQGMMKNCTDEMGITRKHGQYWRSSMDPCLKCNCDNGTVNCLTERCAPYPSNCGPGKVLDKLPGNCCMSCVTKPGICTVFGDPHYRTFDGRPFNFQGDCRYMLAKDCLERNFSVVVQNDAKKSFYFSWTKSVFLNLFATGNLAEMEISLHQHLVVKINGRKMALPYISETVTVVKEREVVKVRTTRGISIDWDGISYLEVGASSYYKSALCGMCGNYNGFTRDDFIGGDGLFKSDKSQFANSWRIGKGDDYCTKRNNLPSAQPCKSVYAKYQSRKKCIIFKSAAFRPCYTVVDPTEYYKSCLTDVCQCPRKRKCSCEATKAYIKACGRQGVKIKWKKNKYCNKICRRGKIYSSCGPSCKFTCKNFKNDKRNERCKQRPCVAGCHCPAGFVLSRNRCVHMKSCSRAVSTNENPFTNILTRKAV